MRRKWRHDVWVTGERRLEMCLSCCFFDPPPVESVTCCTWWRETSLYWGKSRLMDVQAALIRTPTTGCFSKSELLSSDWWWWLERRLHVLSPLFRSCLPTGSVWVCVDGCRRRSERYSESSPTVGRSPPVFWVLLGPSYLEYTPRYHSFCFLLSHVSTVIFVSSHCLSCSWLFTSPVSPHLRLLSALFCLLPPLILWLFLLIIITFCVPLPLISSSSSCCLIFPYFISPLLLTPSSFHSFSFFSLLRQHWTHPVHK